MRTNVSFVSARWQNYNLIFSIIAQNSGTVKHSGRIDKKTALQIFYYFVCAESPKSDGIRFDSLRQSLVYFQQLRGKKISHIDCIRLLICFECNQNVILSAFIMTFQCLNSQKIYKIYVHFANCPRKYLPNLCGLHRIESKKLANQQKICYDSFVPKR